MPIGPLDQELLNFFESLARECELAHLESSHEGWRVSLKRRGHEPIICSAGGCNEAVAAAINEARARGWTFALPITKPAAGPQGPSGHVSRIKDMPWT